MHIAKAEKRYQDLRKLKLGHMGIIQRTLEHILWQIIIWMMEDNIWSIEQEGQRNIS